MDCEKCIHYWNNGKDEYCDTRGWDFKRTGCPDFQDKSKPITNADRIRSMTDEELGKFLGEVQWDVANYCGGVTQKQEYPVPEKRGAWLGWLKEEVSL